MKKSKLASNTLAQDEGIRGKALEIMTNMVHTTLRRADLFQSVLDKKHKIDQDCGYPTEVTDEHFRKLWDRESVAGRVVELHPVESWKDDPEVIESEKASEETEFERRWKELEDQFNLFSLMERADILSGIGRFGVILLGFDDGEMDLTKPVQGVTGFWKPQTKPDKTQKKETKPGEAATVNADPADETPAQGPSQTDTTSSSYIDLLYIRAFAEEFVKIDTYDIDPASPRFMMPELYQIDFNNIREDSQPAAQLGTLKVHWTRIIHIADNIESNEAFGVPRMKKVFNRLFDIRKIAGGSGEMFWRGGFPGMNLKVDPKAGAARALTPDEKAGLKQEIMDYFNGLQRFMALENMSAESIAPQVADPTAHINMNLLLIAIGLGCPLRVFTGTEEGKLAGGQDTKAWNRRMKRRQNKHIIPRIIRPFADRLIEANVMPAPKSGKYLVKFPDLEAASDTEKADIAQKLGAAIVSYASGNAEGTVPPREFLVHILKLDEEVADAIMEAAEEWQGKMEDKADLTDERELAKTAATTRIDVEAQKELIKAQPKAVGKAG